jgi:hypothetical protein
MIRLLRAGFEMRRIVRNDWDDPEFRDDERKAILEARRG